MRQSLRTNTILDFHIQHQVIILNQLILMDISIPRQLLEQLKHLQGVQFSWTSPSLEAVPRWKIKNAGQSFSLVESLQGSWPFKRNDNKSNYYNHNHNGNSKYFWSVILVILCPARVLANTTVAKS